MGRRVRLAGPRETNGEQPRTPGWGSLEERGRRTGGPVIMAGRRVETYAEGATGPAPTMRGLSPAGHAGNRRGGMGS